MEKIHIIMIALLLAAAAISCSTGSIGPHLDAPESYDFGTIYAKDGVVSKDFTMTNTGNSELDILGISTSCGCTSASADKEMLQPGETGTLHVEFDPNAHEGLIGHLDRVVYVRTNDPKVPETQLKLTIDVAEEGGA